MSESDPSSALPAFLPTASFILLLDSNIWIAERLLKSSIGSALLYALAVSRAKIALPEVVELELSAVLPREAEASVEAIRKAIVLLGQLSGSEPTFTGPTEIAIKEGIVERWTQLAATIERVPLSLDQTKAALTRVVNKTSPSGTNNEQ
jgi:hypothetical protein